ncbi:MAG: response regulator transcription factor [Armatimonadetes bacterium]|nr:response regulator transcription factor [Armatimonadota bacterium]
MEVIQIIVAEDATLIRRLIVNMLAREPGFEVVGEAENGREAVEVAEESGADVVVMDLDMPVMNGLAAARRITATQPETSIVLLTAHHNLASVAAMAGASECLLKSCNPSDLVAAVRRAYANRTSRRPDAGQRMVSDLNLGDMALRFGLTDLEAAVLARAADTNLTYKAIAAQVLGSGGKALTEAAVKHTVERVMNKLGVEPRTRAALVRYVLSEVKGHTNSLDDL